MRKPWALLFLLVLLLASLPLTKVEAARGAPGSSEFGFGAHLNMNSPLVLPALEMAANLPLDWIAVDFPWSAYFPTADTRPDWSSLDQVMTYAASHQMAVMVSVRSAPAWAMTSQGPDPEQSGALAAHLLKRYPGTLQAIELFPGANTAAAWGAAPNAAGYSAVAAAVHNKIHQSSGQVLLVLAGLTPLSGRPDDGSLDDLLFLQELYQAGIAKYSSIVSLQMNNLTGDPLLAPDGQDHRILRHYEEVRQVMLNNSHESGLIWITRLLAPCDTMNPVDQSDPDSQRQTAWLVQAYTQLRAQLYIGAVFYDALNPGGTALCSKQGRSLLLDTAQYHSFYPKLRDLIAENAPEAMLSRRGRAKDGEFIKIRP